jgi:hypothetical protein
MDVPWQKENEWGVMFDSPFSTIVEDLARFYFFNFWCSQGEFPPPGGVHHAIMTTDWFMASPHKKPSIELVNRICERFKGEVN